VTARRIAAIRRRPCPRAEQILGGSTPDSVRVHRLRSLLKAKQQKEGSSPFTMNDVQIDREIARHAGAGGAASIAGEASFEA
jgi:hypothetical protein